MSGEDTPRSYVRRGHASILCQMRAVDTPPSWSGEGAPQSYVRRGHASILCQMRTVQVDTPPSWSEVGAPQSYVRRGQRTHLDPSQERIEYTFTLHIRRGHTSILSPCVGMGVIIGDGDERKFVGNKLKGRVEMSTNKRCYIIALHM